jgi:hypothetical protein
MFWYRILHWGITHFTKLLIWVSASRRYMACAVKALILIYLQLGRSTANIRYAELLSLSLSLSLWMRSEIWDTSTPQIFNQLAQPLLSTSVPSIDLTFVALHLSIFVCVSGLQFSEFLEEHVRWFQWKWRWKVSDMVCHDCIEQECFFTWHTVLCEDV